MRLLLALSGSCTLSDPALPTYVAHVKAVSAVGILMLLLLRGMETDVKLVRGRGRASSNG
jgi:hypothetical protein